MVKVLMLGMALAAAQPPTSAPMTPVGKWTVHYADDMCTLERSYGLEARPTILAMRPSPLGRSLEIRLSEPDPAYVGRTDPGTLTLRPSGRAFEIKISSFGPSTDSRRISSFMLQDVPADDLLRADTITFDRKAAAPLALAVGGSDAVIAALTRCQDDLLNHYGIDSVAMHKLSRQPLPVDGGEPAWFKAKDYPKEARTHFRGGRAIARLTIAAGGGVTDCKVGCAPAIRDAAKRPALSLASAAGTVPGAPPPAGRRPRCDWSRSAGRCSSDQAWIGFPVTAIAASLIASECVGWAWQV